MTPGRKLLFYAAGEGKLAQHILASGRLKSITGAKPDCSDDLACDPVKVKTILNLEDIRLFANPFNLKRNRLNLNSLTHKGYFWYTSLQGGCTPISLTDWDFICHDAYGIAE
jgi:hypothetical protein